MEKLVEPSGITRLSQVAGLRDGRRARRPGRATSAAARSTQGPYTFVAADALVLKVREGGRVVNVHALVATGVNADGHREILGLQVTSAEDGAGWLAFFRDLTARGLTGVKLVTSDAHHGLVAAIGATLPGAAWQRCRTHYAANLMAATPKASLAVGAGAAALGLRPARRRLGARPVRPRPRRPGREAAQGRRAPRRRPRRRARVHRRSRRSSGARSGPTIPANGSTARSAAAPTWSGSSPTATP